MQSGTTFTSSHFTDSHFRFSTECSGPSNWGGLCRNGSKQSPIDISSTTAQHDSNLGAFNLLSYNAKPSGVNFTATNDGHTLVVSFDPFVYNVSGGGLTDTFTTAQFHLHWGSVNTQGSEHYLDGAKFPAEVLFILTNFLAYFVSRIFSVATSFTDSQGGPDLRFGACA